MDTEVTLVDVGTGNLRSVFKALESLGANVALTSDPDRVVQAGRVVLPGVGAFGDFMRGMNERGLVEAIHTAVQKGSPLLGICVGMQALFEVGEEMGEHIGLGLIPGRVVNFSRLTGLKVPHTGWNQIVFTGESSLWKEVKPGDYAYFNHAYYCVPADTRHILARTDYGVEFASAVRKENLFGVQFHPEKSQRVGLQVLKNFINTG